MSRASRLALAARFHDRAVWCGLRLARGYQPTLRPNTGFHRKNGHHQHMQQIVNICDADLLANCRLRSEGADAYSPQERTLCFAEAATLLDETNTEYQITLASTYIHLGQYARALEYLLRLLSFTKEPETRSRLFANCAAASERLGDAVQAFKFSELAVSEWRVSRLAVFNHQRLKLSPRQIETTAGRSR